MIDLFGPPTVTYCEQIGNGLIARPYFALTTLTYFLVAFIILSKKRNWGGAKIFAWLIILCASISTIYDIRPIYLTQLFDLTGMFVTVSFLLRMNLLKFWADSKKIIDWILGLSTLVAFIGIVSIRGFAGNAIFGLFAFAYVISEIYSLFQGSRSNGRLWYGALATFFLGTIFWAIDATKMVCIYPLLNGRSFFHYFGAVSFYLLFKYYESQESKNIEQDW